MYIGHEYTPSRYNASQTVHDLHPGRRERIEIDIGDIDDYPDNGGGSLMKYATRYPVLILLMSLTLNTLAEQRKCILLNTGEDIEHFRDSISELCSRGDVLYFRDTFGTDIRVLLAATACDFSKSIIMDGDELACVYSGTKESR